MAAGIVCMLAAMSLGWRWLPHGCGSRVQATRINLAALRQAAERFICERERCPRNLGELAKAEPDGRRWMKDAWAEDVLLVCVPTNTDPIAVTLSAGPDRKFGTDDDLSSAELH